MVDETRDASEGPGPLEHDEPTRQAFLPEVLDKTILASPQLRALEQLGEDDAIDVIIDLNLEYPGGRAAARRQVEDTIDELTADVPDMGVKHGGTTEVGQYVFARLLVRQLRELARGQRERSDEAEGRPRHRPIYRIWNDFEIKALLNHSLVTVKADAAHAAFSAHGKDIVWAVMDSGIDADHPHFNHPDWAPTVIRDDPWALRSRDFTALTEEDERPLDDPLGHGTHVAGIIAGRMEASPEHPIRLVTRRRNEYGDEVQDSEELVTGALSGVAPQCRLVSFKVLSDDGSGRVSNLIRAVSHVQEVNGYGRRIRIHGVNMSVGYDFEPEWFACGQSPLCVEVDRLVRSGVAVVVAAGNTGYGVVQSRARGAVWTGMDLTINDPGNAELAITVGSTHRDMPHLYGVSYFSSKGPTGDGRSKPDLLGPGEKILSCASTAWRSQRRGPFAECHYREESGTSMAAPHVSGAIAAFLSVRREFVGRPERVKEIFLSTATDLKRDRYFQGHGVADLMRALQSV